MAERKIFAGHAVRRLRRREGLTQAAMAAALSVSPSYLNLIERNQRPLTAGVMVRLADLYGFDPRLLAGDAPGGGSEAIRRRLADPLFADLAIDRAEVEEWLAAAPAGVAAFARAFDRLREGGGGGDEEDEAVAAVRAEIERWRNHWPDLDAAAEALADELRLGSADLAAAIAERLRVRHQLSVRILPADVMPDALRRLDLHARQLQLSEMLDPAGRSFQAGWQLALLEAGDEIEALVKGAALPGRAAERLLRRHLAGYFAAALMMPYGRFLRACEATGYDLPLLQRRFTVGFEMLAHRLTTLQRVGARGLPFFMLRLDRAGQVSKRFAGASDAPLAGDPARCPLWNALAAFDRPGAMRVDHVATEDGPGWFTLARTVQPAARSGTGVTAEHVVILGLPASAAGALAAARGVDLSPRAARPIGPGCRRCLRPACPQRALPPAGRALLLSERERTIAPFPFVED